MFWRQFLFLYLSTAVHFTFILHFTINLSKSNSILDVCPCSLKVKLHEMICNNDFECITALQRCVALIIVVAIHPV